MAAETDSHGWKRSRAAGKDFVLTEKRKLLMKQAIALAHCEVILHIASENWDAGATVTRDAADMMELYSLMCEGKMQEAVLVKWKSLDTAARDKYPQWIQEMAGHYIHPEVWDDNESLDSTTH